MARYYYSYLGVVLLMVWVELLSATHQSEVNTTAKISNREKRNFGGIQQPNYELCTTQSGIRGLCMRRAECTRNSGTASGFCGTYGVCCETNLACNAVSRLKRTVIRNPIPLPSRCSYHFQPYSPNVCQLRIDFDMILAQPLIPDGMNNVEAPTCVTDIFQVGDLRLCGTNTNQHIYVPFEVIQGTGDVTVQFTLTNRVQNPTVAAFWNMVVTQLECPPTVNQQNPNQNQNSLRYLKSFLKNPNNDFQLLAPTGCLQYFTEPTGTFDSFNYNNAQGPYLGNLRYSICFRRAAGDTGVRLSATTFSMAAAENAVNNVDLDCHSTIDTPGRPNDYLLIPESVLASTATSPPLFATYYCGTSLQTADLLLAPAGPFVIYFNSDNLYATTERGFRIAYTIQ